MAERTARFRGTNEIAVTLPVKTWREIVATLKPATGTKREPEICRIVDVRTENGRVSFTAARFAELEITRTVETETVFPPARVAFPLENLAAALKGKKGSPTLIFSAEGPSWARLEFDDAGSIALPVTPAAELPLRLREKHSQIDGSLETSAENLKAGAAYTASAVSGPGHVGTFTLECARLTATDNRVVFARLEATDGARLHYSDFPVSNVQTHVQAGREISGGRTFSLLIPRDVLRSLAAKLPAGDVPVSVHRYDDGAGRISAGGVSWAWTEAGQGKTYPDTMKVIPRREAMAEYQLESPAVANLLAVLKPFTSAREKRVVKATFGGNLTAIIGGSATACAPLIRSAPDERATALDARYFYDALETPTPGATVYLPADSLNAVMFTSGERFAAVVMPIRID
jgi:DNA polymerase III sliding clamp (beta) subunit (PCNA family)